jgi:hypothetical protein
MGAKKNMFFNRANDKLRDFEAPVNGGYPQIDKLMVSDENLDMCPGQNIVCFLIQGDGHTPINRV